MIPETPFDTSLVAPGILAADLDALADEFGTPLFVYDEDALRRRCQEYVAAIGPDAVTYAAKSFLCTAMVRLVDEEGLRLDVATGGELHAALNAGFPAARIVFHGNNKSDDEVRAGLEAGVGRTVIDSFDEIARLEAVVAATKPAVPPTVLVRVTPGVEAHTHEFIETGTERSKFGFTVSEGVALAAVRRVVEGGVLHFGGLHSHIGSQIERLDAYGRAVEILSALAGQVADATEASIEELNLGGGLAARYLTDDPDVPVSEYAAALRGAIDAHWSGEQPRLVVEPGRSIAAPCAVTVYRVGTVKEIPGVGTYVAVDGGMSDNPRPVLYGAGYEAYVPARIAEGRPLRCNIVGKHCEQGDVIVNDARLPSGVRVGDLIATPTTGAYGYSMASNYNKVPRPAVVFLRGGEPRLVVRRETYEDLVRLDVV
ncbi:MAG: diaminopimelate decarboxylase [Acidimicrobiia bacterium]|nr:diaminopimelate decarboxylase [Acidimicrobiia bacterium]